MPRLKRTLMKNEVVNGGLLVLAEGWLLVEGDAPPPPTSPDELLELIPKFLVKTRKVQPRGGREEGLLREYPSQAAAKSIQPHENFYFFLISGWFGRPGLVSAAH